MAAPRRVRLALDERRAQLLALGIRLFSNHSYEDISIDEVAAQAGISKGLLYHYFPGKREFYVEVIREASLQLRRLVAPDPQLPPAARLRAAVVAHLNYVEQHGAVYRAIYRSGVSISPEVSVILEEHREVALHYLLDDLKVTRPRPALRAALRAWIALVEGASLDFAAHPEVGRELVTELVIAGYAALLTRAAALDPRTARSLEKVLRRGPVAY
jgi:AcrR family transcriptional regulator